LVKCFFHVDIYFRGNYYRSQITSKNKRNRGIMMATLVILVIGVGIAGMFWYLAEVA